jgi:hypothetical protein
MTTRTDRHQPKQFQIEKFNFETVQSLALFWMLTMIIPFKLEKELYWLTSVFME